MSNPLLRVALFVILGALLAFLLFELIVALGHLLDVPLLRDVGKNVDGGTAGAGAGGAGAGAGGAAGGGAGGGKGKSPPAKKETPQEKRDREMQEQVDREQEFKRLQDEYLKQHPEAVPEYQPEPPASDKAQNTFWKAFWTMGGKSPR